MIVDRKFSVLEESSGDFQDIDASLSLDDMDLIFSIVSENFYSDVIGSIVRELASNCVDSHTEAKVDDSILIRGWNDEGTNFISFIDVGTGLGPERFQKIYMKYFKSTKRESNEYVGYFGIGSKSPLGYTDSFEVITRSEGIEYYYVVGKSETGKPKASLLTQRETLERNGTEVRIAIEDGDWGKYEDAIKAQLRYFDNVYVEGFYIQNDYNIIEGNTFKYRYSLSDTSHRSDKSMHICFGKVVYPLDWSKLNLNLIDLPAGEIQMPVGIKFNIGDFNVTNNREAVVYSDETKELILQRIKGVLEEVRDLYNKQNQEDLGLGDFIKLRNNPSKTVKLGLSSLTLPTWMKQGKSGNYRQADLIKGLNNCNYKEFEGLPMVLPDNPFSILFESKAVINDGNVNKRDEKSFKVDVNLSREMLIYPLISAYRFYRMRDSIDRPKNKYLLWRESQEALHTRKRNICLIVKKKIIRSSKAHKEDDWQGLCSSLEIKGDSKEIKKIRAQRIDYRRRLEDAGLFLDYESENSYAIPIITEEYNKTKLILTFRRLMTRELASITKSYEKEEPSAHYRHLLSIERQQCRKIKEKGVINAYSMYSSSSVELDLSTLENFTGLLFYSVKGDTKRLRFVYETVRDTLRIVDYKEQKAIRGYIIGKSFVKHFKGNPYFMSVDEFFTNNNSIASKIATGCVISERVSKLNLDYYTLINNIKKFQPDIGEKISRIKKFRTRYGEAAEKLRYSQEFKELVSLLVDTAVQNNLLDKGTIEEMEEIEVFFKELELLSYIKEEAFGEEEGLKKIIEYLKFKKKKLEAIHYFVPTEEEMQWLNEAEENKKYKTELERMRKATSYRNYQLHKSVYFN